MMVNEGLEMGDLVRVVLPVLEIDTYQSKMGNDEDVCVVGFSIKSKAPAEDLVNFVEKGYSFVLDADCSSGEDDSGNYQVFVEIERTPEVPAQIIEIIKDLLNLTEQKEDEWKFRYYRNNKTFQLTDAELRKHILLTPDEYKKTVKQDKDELDSLKLAAGVKVKSKPNKNKDMDELQVAAGIK